jgi:tetratricopeptide (TPR) repeat protein
LTGAVGCFLVVVVLVALSLAGVRLPGQGATGSVNLPANETVADQLTEARVLASEGHYQEAVTLYDSVLTHAPNNLEARTYEAWLFRFIGIAGDAREEVRAADTKLQAVTRDAPGYAPARAFYGIAVLDDAGRADVAAAQFRAFLADHPDASLAESVAPEIAAAYNEAHLTPPPQLKGLLNQATATATTTA